MAARQFRMPGAASIGGARAMRYESPAPGAGGARGFRRGRGGGAPGLPFEEDTFDTDSTGMYTQYADIPATWQVQDGALVATGGGHSIFVRNATNYTDTAVEAEVSQAYDGGLVLRFIDNNNYYLLTLAGGVSSVGSPSVRLYRRVAGAFTSLTAASQIVWPLGTAQTFRFRVSGTTLTAFVNGQQVLTVEDSSLTGPGGVGMRNTAGGDRTSIYQTFRWNIPI